MTDAELRDAAAALSGEPVRALEVVRGGGNNRLYRVRGPARSYALKRYPDDARDARARYEREFGALTFVWACGERNVPEPVALDRARGLALYAWIEGTRIDARTPGDIDDMVAFLARLHARRTLPGAGDLAPAREAVFAPSDLRFQVQTRVARLREPAAANEALAALLDEIDVLASAGAAAGDEPLPAGLRTLSPSDFGTHNALRTAAGSVFLDFEYFGWDDPVKLVADALWHPGMALEAAERRKFFAGATDVYGVDRSFQARFERDAPLYGLRWALIVLNEFLPAMWQRRVAAGERASHAAVLERQFAKATALVERARSGAALV